MRPRIAILTGSKGRGSNMAAIVRAVQSGAVPGEIALVLSPKADAPALEVARNLGISQVIGSEDLETHLDPGRVDWICLAGFMRLLPPTVLQRFPRRVLNIHPALLPKFGGKGMYGHHVHEAVLASGDALTGCTVHYVTERYDEGDPIVQFSCPVMPGDTAETLAARVLELEHLAYPLALRYAIERDHAGRPGS